jgi:acyl-CoA dehydrogenase
MSAALAGGVFDNTRGTDDLDDLRHLVKGIGTLSRQARTTAQKAADGLDTLAWQHLEDAGLTRLTSTPDSGGGPTELALILRALAYHAVAVPLAETDLLACWLADRAELVVPQCGPLTIAYGLAPNPTLTAPYARDAATVVLARREGDTLLVANVAPAELTVIPGHNLGGEPRDVIHGDLPKDSVSLKGVAKEFVRRATWARCMQTVGALDAAVESTVSHTRNRTQFGRPLSAFQAVQHTLASMAGEVERARAAATLAVAATADFGFDSPQADYATIVAKIVLGQVVPVVCGSAHQLHGAIGTTVEHRLWLATMRARSWIEEFGNTADYARRLGRMALQTARDGDPWDVIIGDVTAAQQN